MSPLMARISVLLPQPDGPATRSTSPGWMVSDRSCNAGSEARRYRKVRFAMSTIGSATPATGSGRADRDRAVGRDAESAGSIGLVVGEAEAARGVLVQQRAADRDVAEGAGPRRGFDDRPAPVRGAEFHAQLWPRRQLADGADQVVALAREAQVAERVDVDDRALEDALADLRLR